MYCTKCGQELAYCARYPELDICPVCGQLHKDGVAVPDPGTRQQGSPPPPFAGGQYQAQAHPHPQPQPQPQYGTPTYKPTDTSLRTAAFAFNIVGCVIYGAASFGIALAWCIPMTVRSYRLINDPFKHNAFAVCDLLFASLIGGILFLCSGGQEPYPPNYSQNPPPGYRG